MMIPQVQIGSSTTIHEIILFIPFEHSNNTRVYLLLLDTYSIILVRLVVPVS